MFAQVTRLGHCLQFEVRDGFAGCVAGDDLPALLLRMGREGVTRVDVRDQRPRPDHEKLREAVHAAGWAVMQTSGDWSIHPVTEKAKRAEEVDTALANRTVELEVALKEAIDRMARARAILTDGNPRVNCNWGMLDPSNLKAVLDKDIGEGQCYFEMALDNLLLRKAAEDLLNDWTNVKTRDNLRAVLSGESAPHPTY